MRWKDGRRSDNVDDRRGESPPASAAGAAPMVLRLLPALLKTKTGRTILIVAVVVIFGGKLLGIDVLSLLAGGGASNSGGSPAQFSEREQQRADFVSVILADTEDTWREIFRVNGLQYRDPTLVLFSGRVNSACGLASSAVGPFYCPGDQQVYIDLSFFDDLSQRHGAPGDFAQAYVLAHEVGHHVQTLLGISQKVQQLGRGRSQADVNALSVRQELQADCFAGIWGHAANTQRQLLDPGDLEEALRAATAIGDDRLQREAGRQVVPDSFTHGSSEQRVTWFRRGFEGGLLDNCDTFAGAP
ncbi:neutral zinc metallopeptidase [Haliea sp. E17]|uniref:KPN_02809 family neutral zinc metallopeptidase n=1 Tax=Haliea sp. E17 TaxID=3401576 RepID=UPI003AAEEEEF